MIVMIVVLLMIVKMIRKKNEKYVVTGKKIRKIANEGILRVIIIIIVMIKIKALYQYGGQVEYSTLLYYIITALSYHLQPYLILN